MRFSLRWCILYVNSILAGRTLTIQCGIWEFRFLVLVFAGCGKNTRRRIVEIFTYRELRFLSFVIKHPDLPFQELCLKIGIRQTEVVRLRKSLQERGLLLVQKQNRNALCCSLTSKGRQALGKPEKLPALTSILAQSPSDGTCRHYWIIEAPTGPVSRGKCQHCGQVREFQNAFRM